MDEPPAQSAPDANASDRRDGEKADGKPALLKGLREGNTKIQLEQQKQLDDPLEGKGGIEEGGIGGQGFGGGIF